MENIFNDINFGPKIEKSTIGYPKDHVFEWKLMGTKYALIDHDAQQQLINTLTDLAIEKEEECTEDDYVVLKPGAVTFGNYELWTEYRILEVDYSDDTILLVDETEDECWERLDNFVLVD